MSKSFWVTTMIREHSLTSMQDTLEEKNALLLVDSGYSSSQLITPDDEMSKEWNHTQKGLRSVVEVAIGMVQHYTVAAERVSQNPEFHAMAVLCCYHLTNMNLKLYPLRVYLK